MEISPYTGKPARPVMLVNVPKLITAYYIPMPDPSVPAEQAAFGTSGDRGLAFDNAFNKWHIWPGGYRTTKVLRFPCKPLKYCGNVDLIDERKNDEKKNWN